MPFFTTRPTSRISPIADETFRSVPVSSSSEQRAAERQRRGAQDQQRGRERAELHDQDREHQRRGDAEHHQQLAERLPLRLVLAADLVACSRPAASSRRSFAVISATALPRSRSSSRPVTSAICRRFSRSSSACPLARHRAPALDDGHELAVARVAAASARSCVRIEADRVGVAARAPGCVRSSRRRSVRDLAEPAADELLRRPARRSARARPAATGSTCPRRLRGCRAARRRRRRRRRPCSSISSTGSASSAEHARDRRRRS